MHADEYILAMHRNPGVFTSSLITIIQADCTMAWQGIRFYKRARLV
jgi:hypothetical protein